MSNKKQTSIQVVFATEFKRNIRRLSRKYPHIRADVDPVIAQLAADNLFEK